MSMSKSSTKPHVGGDLAAIASGGGGRGEAAATDAYQEDCVTLLRAAIDLRDRTGALPSKQLAPQILEAVRGSLHADLSEKNVFNRLRTLRRNLKHGCSSAGAPLVHELSVELWNWNKKMKDEEDEENEQQVQKTNEKGDENAQGPECGWESLIFLKAALEKEGYSVPILDKDNFADAKALDKRIKKYLKNKIKYAIKCKEFEIGIMKMVKKTL